MAGSNDAPFIITRREARATGLTWYFEKPCLHGHLAKRKVRGKQCLECHRLARAALRASDPERVRRQKASSYLRHRAEVIAHVAEYTEANRQKVRERRRKHRQANKERLAADYAAWAKENRPLLRIHEKRRRDRKRGAVGSHTLADIRALETKQKWRCAGCHVSIRDGYHIDHIEPLARGGTDNADNIQLLCAPCNQSKHARDPIEWAQSNGRLL